MSYKSILLLFFSFLFSFNSFADNKFLFPSSPENYITYSDSGFYCSYLKIYSQTGKQYFFTLTKPDSKIFLFSGENVVDVSNENYPLVNFNFPFLTLKYNVIPYLHPLFAIKFLYILKKLKFLPRVSDAMRTVENQLKYKRRGWSNVESSPHLLGIAADLSYFTRYDREQILRYNVSLSVHFLEHGGKGNHHIHLQDEDVWNMIKEKNVYDISDSLNKKIARNYNMLKPYAGSYYQYNFIPDVSFNFISEKLDFIIPVI